MDVLGILRTLAVPFRGICRTVTNALAFYAIVKHAILKFIEETGNAILAIRQTIWVQTFCIHHLEKLVSHFLHLLAGIVTDLPQLLSVVLHKAFLAQLLVQRSVL